MKRILELDGVRTIAVLSVITSHYAPFPVLFNDVFAKYGGLGVDVFFVLSGYLITSILLGLKGTEHPYKVFYARRFLRIMPSYLLLLVLVYSIAASVHDPIDAQKVAGQLLFLRSFNKLGMDVHNLLTILRHPHLIPNPFAITLHKVAEPDYAVLPITGSLGPTWSLSVEEWFYVLWAPVVLLFRRPAIVAIGSSMCIFGLLLRWFLTDPAAYISRSADILIAGALLAVWLEHRKTLATSVQRRFDGIVDVATISASFVYVVLAVIHRELLSMTFAEIAFAGAIAWLIRHANSANLASSFLRWKPMVYVGSISYMIYLIHLPMYFVVRSAITRVGSDIDQEARYWLVSVLSLVLSIAFSAISWKFYEEPILRYKDQLTRWISGQRGEAA